MPGADLACSCSVKQIKEQSRDTQIKITQDDPAGQLDECRLQTWVAKQ